MQVLHFPQVRPGTAGARVRIADSLFRYCMTACAMSVLAIVALILVELTRQSQLSLHTFGWKFFLGQAWDPVAGDFGALPFVYGTLVSSFLALLISVPLAVGLAIYITEMCSQRLRGVLAFTTDLLAAIPSVIYGLWAIFVLVPLAASLCRAVVENHAGMDRVLRGAALRHRDACPPGPSWQSWSSRSSPPSRERCWAPYRATNGKPLWRWAPRVGR